MHTDENRNHALKFFRVYPCPSVVENHFLPPSSDDNFSCAFAKSTGFGASVFGADFSGCGAGAVGCTSAASLLSSTFVVALSAAGLAATGGVCGNDNFSKTLSVAGLASMPPRKYSATRAPDWAPQVSSSLASSRHGPISARAGNAGKPAQRTPSRRVIVALGGRMGAFSPFNLFCSNGRPLEQAAVFRRFGDIARAKGKADRVELAGIVSRHGRRPAFVAVEQVNRDLGGIFAFVDEFCGFTDHLLVRCLKSLSHNLGSGRYAVTRTAVPRSAETAHTA